MTSTSSSNEPKQVCRSYLWGSCKKNTYCKFRHELDIEEMKNVLKFCHEYQNKNSCKRTHCSYLHTTIEEENLFFATGKIPRVLAERHAAMHKATMATKGRSREIPEIPMFIRQCYVQTSQQSGVPGPVAPALVPTSWMSTPRPALPPTQPSVHKMPAMHPLVMPLQVMPLALQQPLPPPPSVVFPMNQPPPPLPVMFDGSKPLPTLPAQIKASSDAVKHKASNLSEAGPSKRWKPGCSHVGDAHGENCVQLEIRAHLISLQLEKLRCENKDLTLTYKNKMEQSKCLKEVLRFIVDDDSFWILEELIENLQNQNENNLSEQIKNGLFDMIMLKLTKQLMLKFMTHVIDNTREHVYRDLTGNQSIDSLLDFLSERMNIVVNTPPTIKLLRTFIDQLKKWDNLLQNANRK